MVDFEKDIKNCIQVLEKGGVILYPTDTVWGLGCDAMNEAAVEKIFALKQRPKEKSLIVLLAEARDMLQYIAAPHPDIIAILEDFEKPTTVIYEDALDFPENVLHIDGSIAIRVTNDPFCKALIKRFKKPIVSTSANVSGQPTSALFSDIAPEILHGADYTVQYRQQETTVRPPSRLVKIMDDGSLEIIRP
jgi:L-threonylcarbamoyladenylate synthase